MIRRVPSKMSSICIQNDSYQKDQWIKFAMPQGRDPENILSRRLNKVLQIRLENDNETLQALKQLSTFYTENTLQGRRNLRSQIERRSLAINESFLSAFREAKDSFDDVYKDIVDMRTGLLAMSGRLESAQVHTKQLLDQTAHLQQAEERNTAKERALRAVQDTVLLTGDDLRALHGREDGGDLGVDIFQAIDKVERQMGDANKLIEGGCTELGQSALESLFSHKEKAVDRLYRWTKQHCHYVQRAEYTEIVTRAMQRLEAETSLFYHIIREYVISRRGHLVAEFIDALTRGGPAGNPAPIESRAHNPQVYVTDVLVWIQRALPSERRGITVLLSACGHTANIPKISDEAMAHICEGVCHPLKIRIEKVLTPRPVLDASILYSLMNLIRYYRKMIAKVSSGGELGATLDSIEARGESIFMGRLESRVSDRLAKVETPGRDLAPTAALHALLSHLRDLLSTASMTEARESDMNKIAQCVVEPLLRAVSEQASRLPPPDMAAYTLNCMYAMVTCLALYQFQERRLERLTAQAEAQIDTLTSVQASALVANLSLSAIYTILQESGAGNTQRTPLSTIPGMEPSNLKNFMMKFNGAVSKPDSLLIPQINLLASSQHKKAVQKRSFLVLLGIYNQLYEAVHSPVNLYDSPETILPMTPDKLSAMINN